MLLLVPCPECDVPAEITERFRLPSTDGAVEHIAVQCVAGHYFRMAADRLASRSPGLVPLVQVPIEPASEQMAYPALPRGTTRPLS